MATSVLQYGLTPEQLADRKNGIGASEIGAVLGLDRYKSAIDVWLEKTGRRQPDWSPSSQAAKMGHLLEPVVAQLAEERYSVLYEGMTVQVQSSPTVVGAMDWMRATPDRIVTSGFPYGTEQWVLEFKTKSWNTYKDFGAEGTDAVPHSILLQALWQMMVTGLRRCDVAVLVDGREFFIHPVHFDADLASDVGERIASFWYDHVVADKEPPIAHRNDVAYLREKFSAHSAELAPVTSELDAAVNLLAITKAELKRLEEQEELAKARVMQLVGTYKGAHTSSGKVSWTSSAGRTTVDYKAILDYTANHILKEQEQKRLLEDVRATYTTIGAPSRTFRFTPAKEA